VLNIPFLKKVAVWLHIIGCCYIILLPVADIVDVYSLRDGSSDMQGKMGYNR
jgi:hypothetical protein